MPFPSDKVLAEARKKLRRRPGTALPGDHVLSVTDKLKHGLCSLFVQYFNSHNLTQAEMSSLLSLDPAVVSKILHYKYGNFTVDYLIKHLTPLYKETSLDIKIIQKKVKSA
jgi:predicted XRE-type DNA-binding protein